MFEVRDASFGTKLPGIPSPLLIETGYGWAYDAGEPDHPYWRLRDDSYDPPGTTYRKVRIVHVEDFWVTVEVTIEGEEPFKDDFLVTAANPDEAMLLGRERAVEEYRDREDRSFTVRALGARRGY